MSWYTAHLIMEYSPYQNCKSEKQGNLEDIR